MTCGNKVALLQWTQPCIYVSTLVLMDMAVKTSGRSNRCWRIARIAVKSLRLILQVLLLLVLLWKTLRLFYIIIANVMYSMYSIVVLYHYYCRNSAPSVAFIFIQSLFSLLILNGIPYTSILCSDIYIILHIMIISTWMLSVHCVLDISDDHRLSIACLLQDPGEVVTKFGETSFIPGNSCDSISQSVPFPDCNSCLNI